MKLVKGIFLAGILVCMATAALAGDKNWVGTYGDSWSTAGNWSSGSVPVAGDNVYITQGSSPVVYDDSGAPKLGWLDVDNNMTLQVGTGYNLRFLLERIGIVSMGQLDQLGGTNTLDTLTLGWKETGVGTYNLISGVLSAPIQYIGDNGQGTLNQSGGSNNTYWFCLGLQGTGVGTYNLTGGDLNTGVQAYVGATGRGVLNQLGGVNNVSANGLFIGGYATGVGTYNLNGGNLNVSHTAEYIGDYGQGTFNQTGGTHNISNNLAVGLYLGGHSTGVGEYNLGGGLLMATSTIEYIGDYGLGTFNQTAGDHNSVWAAGYALFLGVHPSGMGIYNLSRGSLSEMAEVIGDLGQGIFNQDGGVNNVTMLALAQGAGSGVYNLNAGELNALDAHIGMAGSGTFNQAGGLHKVSGVSLDFGLLSTGIGQYNLVDGELRAPDVAVGVKGQGIFNQLGGTNTVSVALRIGNGISSYNMSGGILTVGQVNRDDAGEELSFSPATIMNNGLFYIHNGGTAVQPILIRGDITNNNEFQTTHATVSFDGTFTNQGAFYSYASTMVFHNLYVGADGYLAGAAGDVYRIAGNFSNTSFQNELWQTRNAQLIFADAAEVHELLFNSDDMGATLAAYENNFAWGMVDFGGEDSDAELLVGSLALYTGLLLGIELDMDGKVSNLSGDSNVYYIYDPSHPGANGYLNGQTYAFASGNGQLIPVITPEPASIILYALGGLPLAARFLRRRKVVRG